MPQIPGNTSVLIGGALCVLALVVRLVAIDFRVPEFYEEWYPMNLAWQMGGWGPERPFDPNPHFFHYPSLTFWAHALGQGVLYLGMLATGRVESTLDFRTLWAIDRAPFFFAARTITALFGTATVGVLYALAGRAGGRVAAILAGLFLALQPLHVRLSQSIAVDVPLTFFATWALYELTRLLERPGRGASLRAGVAVGLAASAKYTGAFLAIPAIVAHVLAPRGRRAPGGGGAPRLRDSIPIMLAGAALAFALTSPFVVLDARRAWRDLSEEREHMRLGHFGGEQQGTMETYASFLATDALGWPLAVLAIGGIVLFAVVERRKWAWVLGSHVLVMLGILASWSMRAERYLLPVLPALLVFAAALLARLLTLGPSPARRAVAGIAAVAVALLAVSFARTVRDQTALRSNNVRTSAKRWIEAHCPTGTLLLTEPHGADYFDMAEFARLDADVRARAREPLGKRVVVAEVQLPVFQVMPERSAPFYDLSLYQDADLVLTSRDVRQRYEQDPARFPKQLAFYDSLETRFRKIEEFRSSPSAEPEIVVYANPGAGKPFAYRDDVVGPTPLARAERSPPADEAYFYFVWGVNYESFGFLDDALRAYEIAATYPMTRDGLPETVAAAIVRCRALIAGAEPPGR